MRTAIKIILIFALLMVGGLIIAISKKATDSSGGGPIVVILAAIIFAVIRAIWKYNPDKENQNNKDIQKRNNENQQLDKS